MLIFIEFFFTHNLWNFKKHEAATTPEPHESVSSSTPLSNVLILNDLLLIEIKFMLKPPFIEL